MVKKISADEFDAISAPDGKNVLVKFFANWCGPCRQFAPVLEKFAAAHPEIDVYEMDIDSPENLELISELGVTTVPTVIHLRNGEMVSRVSGFLNLHDLEKLEL